MSERYWVVIAGEIRRDDKSEIIGYVPVTQEAQAIADRLNALEGENANLKIDVKQGEQVIADMSYEHDRAIADLKRDLSHARNETAFERSQRDELDQIVGDLRRQLAEAYTEASNVAGRAIAEWIARFSMGVEQEPLATRVVRAIRSIIPPKEAET